MPDLLELLPELIFGGLIVLFAVGLAWQQWRSSQAQLAEFQDDAGATRFLRRRLRRRLQVAVMLAVIGVMLPIGVYWPLFQGRLTLLVAYWSIVLLLIFWVMLLAMADFASTVLQSKAAQGRLQRDISLLKNELHRYRHQSNGSTDHHAES